MKEYYSTKEVSAATGASEQIIRAYTQRYARYLSTEATPESGKSRRFTITDLKLIAYIYRQTANNNMTHTQVVESLEVGALEHFEWEPELLSATNSSESASSASSALVPVERLQTAQALLMAAQQREQEAREQEQRLQQRVAELERDLGKAQGALETYKALRSRPAWWRWLFGGE